MSRRAAALPAGRLEGRLRAAGDDLRAVELPRQHRRRADRRHDGARGVPRQGAHRLPGGDRRGVQRRRLGQRRRRHDHDHDVDRRRATRCRSSRPIRRPVSPCSIFGIPAALQQHGIRRSPRTRRADVQVDWARVAHRRDDPDHGDHRQRRRQRPLRGYRRHVSVHRRGRLGGDPHLRPDLREPHWLEVLPERSAAASSCCRWCCARR